MYWMAMISNVLLPTDGSKGAQRGVEHALEIAESYDATLHVLYVVDERTHGLTPALSSDEVYLEKLEEDGMEVLGDVVVRAEERAIETKTECVRGMPHEAIVAYAMENDIDLIVMGIHGTGENRSPATGSVTERVIRTCTCRVLPV